MSSLHNPHIRAGRYNDLPANECVGIRNSLMGLIVTSNDEDFIIDGIMRIEALDRRIANA